MTPLAGPGPDATTIRAATPRVLAALVRRGADLHQAQDALQEALLAAALQWPDDGTPHDPVAWLVTVAQRRLIDAWRADAARLRREDTLAREAREPDAISGTDDSVALLLACCHPALPRASQVALTLRAVAGLTTAQIARGFLVPEATMAQRLSRARARLRETGARFGPPTAAQVPARIVAALDVLYLLFSEGHVTTVGADLVDVSLTDEAVRLTRRLHAALPHESEVSGLLALMLLTDARRGARTTADGALVPLADQDRSRWDAGAVAEGIGLVETALPQGPVGRFQLQAAIAAVHAEATRAADTDWPQIEVLYRMLADLDPGPMVTLNHAVAMAMVDGAAAGLDLLDGLAGDRRLTRHHRYHAVRAHLLHRDGRIAQAAEEFAHAAVLATSTPEQRYLQERAAELRDGTKRTEG